MDKKTQSALVIVDMQKEFINRNTKDVPGRIEKFLEKRADAFSLIIGTQYVNHEGTACYQYEGWKKCMVGDDGTELCHELREYMDCVVQKDKYTCYTDEFQKILKQHGIKKVYFCGVNTGCCVLHSVLDCYEDVMDCYVISDLCGSTSGKHYHDISIDLLGTLITKERLISSDEIR